MADKGKPTTAVERILGAAADARQAMRAQTAFAEPVVQNGLTIVPAARTRGGFGGGGGEGEAGQGSGSGMGYGMSARPIGAFVISDEEVTWKPAIDLNLAFILAGAVAALVILASVLDD